MNQYPKRLIEVDLPIKRISAHASREKSIRHGHISTLHIWWARRPLAACRAVLCASLWPDPVDPLCPKEFREKARELMLEWTKKHINLLGPESQSHFLKVYNNPKLLDNNLSLRKALLDFIADFSDWDNSTNETYLNSAKLLTQIAHKSMGSLEANPLVYDPFAGGGSFPLEAARIGSNTFAGDLNPLATLLNKIILEYLPKNKTYIYENIKKWGEIYKNLLTKELSEYYPLDKDGSEPIAYFWARTIKCEGPNCGVEVPIIRNFQFAKRKGSEAGVKIYYRECKLQSELVFGEEANKLIGGTSKRSSVICPNCGYTTTRENVEIQSKNKGFGYYIFAVCIRSIQDGKKRYRSPQQEDINSLKKAGRVLSIWKDKSIEKISYIPNEELPYLRSIFNVRVYGIDKWSKLFTSRQLLSAIIHINILRKLIGKIKKEITDESQFQSIITSLALIISNGLQYQCNIATYLSDGIVSAFIQGQSLGMKMDFVEANPIMHKLVGGYDYSLEKYLSGIKYLLSFSYNTGTAQQISALKQILPEDSYDLLATDPPYYDAVPYADCSDFFYVWLKRMLLGYNDLFKNELSPKNEEIVQLAERNEKYKVRTKQWFEDKMCEALNIARISLRPTGGAIIVFAHKQTAAWEALLQSVLNAGWVITGSWPIDTEKTTRLRANNSAVLSSSIHLFCRPRENPDGSLRNDVVGDWRDVLQELPKRLHDWMPRLAKEGVVGADAIFACLGPALEIFSRYSKVEKANGETVTLKEYLNYVWAAIAKEALNTIFEGSDISGLEEDARLTVMWLWTLFASKTNGDAQKEVAVDILPKIKGFALDSDTAFKIAQGLGIHIENLDSLVRVEGEQTRLLSVEERALLLFSRHKKVEPKKHKPESNQELLFIELKKEEKDESGESGDIIKSISWKTLLDKVHSAMYLFGQSRSEMLKKFIVEEGVGKNQQFWKLAQSLSALYPSQSDEKRWIDGVLAKKKSFGF